MSRLVLYISLSIALHLLAVFPRLAEQFAPDAQAAVVSARVEPVALALPKVRMQTAQAKPVVSEVASEAVVEAVIEQPRAPVVEPSQPKSQSKPKTQPQPVKPVAVQQRNPQPTPQAKPEIQAQESKPLEPLRSKPEAKIEDLVAAQVEAQPDTAAVESPSTQTPTQPDAAPTTAVQATQAESVPAEIISTQPRFARAPAPPVYPAQAKRRQQQGTVWLEVRLNAQGRQLAVQVLRTSGVPSLDKAALAAVRKWQFLPEQHNGVGVPSRVHIPIEFAIAAHR